MGELLSISWPLIIAAAANMFMILSDRIVLSKYSEEALQAQATAISWWWTIYFTAFNIAIISRVMVGRCNGSGELKMIGPIIWQMIWFSAILLFPLSAIAIWVVPHLFAQNLRQLGIPYLRIMLMGTPIAIAAFGALASHLAGNGKTRRVLSVVATVNVINLLLAILLVHGIWPFPQMGIYGTAVATICSQTMALLLFAWEFFQKNDQGIYNTTRWQFDGKLFYSLWKIGLPNALSAFFTWALWSCMYQVAAIYAPGNHFTTLIVGHSIFSGMFFLVEGLSQGTGVVCAHAYGAKEWHIMARCSRSWICILSMECLISSLFLIFYPRPLIAIILPRNADLAIVPLIEKMLIFMWLMLFTSGCSNCLRNQLTVIGDTKFILWGNLFLYTFCNFFLSYLALRYGHNILLAAAAWIFYYTIFSIACHRRLRIFFRKCPAEK
ncbi:MAG: hypothetical protein LBG86_02145 [Puniceicoccales bacterium]|nr:hypothetical protein [Puniceicoccales bacterium]